MLNRYVLPAFGKRKIDSIKPSELVLWQSKLLETLSSKSVTNARVIFHGVLEDALRDELIPRNPFSIVKSVKITDTKEINPFSKSEIFKVLENTPLKIKLFFAIGFFTGLRTGKIIALRYSDIDLNSRVIKVTKTRNKGIETTPKTKSSNREVEILDALIPYIEEHIKNYKINDSDYVFLTKFKQPYYSATKISTVYW